MVERAGKEDSIELDFSSLALSCRSVVEEVGGQATNEIPLHSGRLNLLHDYCDISTVAIISTRLEYCSTLGDWKFGWGGTFVRW